VGGEGGGDVRPLRATESTAQQNGQQSLRRSKMGSNSKCFKRKNWFSAFNIF